MSESSDLVRSSADLMVLAVLADGPLYGYAISKRVASQSDNQVRITPGVLYPLLHEIEAAGLVTSSWETVKADDREEGDRGRRRKWYRLTPKGRRKLASRIESHRRSQAILDSFLRPSEGGAGT